MLWIVSIGGGRSGMNSVDGRFMMTVSVLLFLTAMSGMHHSLVKASHQPCRMAPPITAMMVSFAL